MFRRHAARLRAAAVASAAAAAPRELPSQMRSTFVRCDGTEELASWIAESGSTYRTMPSSTDLSAAARPVIIVDATSGLITPDAAVPQDMNEFDETPSNGYGDESTPAKLEAPKAARKAGPFGRKGMWGKTYFGNIFHTPVNFPYRFGKYWARRFKIKKHRYTKRWRKRRYKVAALANMPFAKKLRVSMLPRLQQGKGHKAATEDIDGFTSSMQSHVARAHSGESQGSGRLRRPRPKSKYTN